MLKSKYNPETSPWIWRAADHSDTHDIVRMAVAGFKKEIDEIIPTDPYYYASNIDKAVIEQSYYHNKELVIVCRDKESNQLLAYTWVKRGNYMSFAHIEMAEVKFVHFDMTLSARKRLTMLAQMIEHWINWTKACGITVLVSSSILDNQSAFMRLHEQYGFSVRGSIGYLRLEGETNE